MRAARLLAFGLLVGLLGAGEAWAERFILHAPPTQRDRICRTHGLQPVRELGRSDLLLVEGPGDIPPEELKARVKAALGVVGFERDGLARVPEVFANLERRQSTAAILDALADPGTVDFFGTLAWVGYVQQPAAGLISLGPLHEARHTGAGTVVALIDTEVDPDHPLLQGSLVPGYDFTRDFAGAGSEWPDLSEGAVLDRKQSTAAILDRKQSTAAILDETSQPVLINPSTAAVLSAQEAADLEQATPPPAAFGHGTMVAGLIHLVAPAARIMPLKAFSTDGTSRASDIIRAIYYAADHGAKVINMSFSLEQPSAGVTRAISYASSQGLICVAAAGNKGVQTLVYPAANRRTFGVAATTLEDERAPFSNYGEALVELAAPGVDLLTTYPGAHYAGVSGTSFSSALVSGTLAVMAGLDPAITYKDADLALGHADLVFISRDLGQGRIDVLKAVEALLAQRPRRAVAPSPR